MKTILSSRVVENREQAEPGLRIWLDRLVSKLVGTSGSPGLPSPLLLGVLTCSHRWAGFAELTP